MVTSTNLPDSVLNWAMDLAIGQAESAAAGGDVPVGAVVLDPSGGLVAAAGNRKEALADPTAHAEVLALRMAAAQVKTCHLIDCTLVVTLEPCPMCAGAATLARIKQVVLGTWDPKAGAAGSVWDVLRDGRSNHWVQVRGGIQQDRCAEILVDFFADRRLQ